MIVSSHLTTVSHLPRNTELNDYLDNGYQMEQGWQFTKNLLEAVTSSNHLAILQIGEDTHEQIYHLGCWPFSGSWTIFQWLPSFTLALLKSDPLSSPWSWVSSLEP